MKRRARDEVSAYGQRASRLQEKRTGRVSRKSRQQDAFRKIKKMRQREAASRPSQQAADGATSTVAGEEVTWTQGQCPSGKAILLLTSSVLLDVHMFWHNAGNIVKFAEDR